MPAPEVLPMWARGTGPGYLELSRQLTEAKTSQSWLAQGS